MQQAGLEGVIARFITKMQQQYEIEGALLTGSCVSGKMQAHSDIDVFFIWRNQGESMRGRSFCEGQEFETFFSPAWKKPSKEA